MAPGSSSTSYGDGQYTMTDLPCVHSGVQAICGFSAVKRHAHSSVLPDAAAVTQSAGKGWQPTASPDDPEQVPENVVYPVPPPKQ